MFFYTQLQSSLALVPTLTFNAFLVRNMFLHNIFCVILVVIVPHCLSYNISTNCDPNFTYFEGLGCYMLGSEELLTWQEAEDYCGTKNAFLVCS